MDCVVFCLRSVSCVDLIQSGWSLIVCAAPAAHSDLLSCTFKSTVLVGLKGKHSLNLYIYIFMILPYADFILKPVWSHLRQEKLSFHKLHRFLKLHISVPKFKRLWMFCSDFLKLF